MKKLIAFLFVCGFGVLALAATRPPSEFDLMTRLNGQPTRWLQADAGVSVLQGSGQACIPLAPYVCNAVIDPGCLADAGYWDAGSCTQSTTVCVTGPQTTMLTNSVVKLTPDVPMNVCVRPQLDVNTGKALAWDGGCSTNPGDLNFGDPIQPNQPYYLNVAPGATTLCEVNDAGTANTAVFRMQ